MSFATRLKTARKHADLTQAELAEKLGINQVSISDLERGKSSSSLYSYQIAKICGVDPEWLVMGEGSEMRYGRRENKRSGEVREDFSTYDMSGYTPIISYVQAGEFCDAEDPYEPGDADDWLPFRPSNAGPRSYALRVEGDSNAPRIQPGEVVIVDPDAHADPGKFVIAKKTSSQAVSLKQLGSDGGEYYLKAANPDWPERIIRLDEHWVVCGVVIGKFDPM